ncbi:MAG: peroxiredoxin [Candidatus Parcubacteria bacterium]|jgi:peroxiredoxin Q/BCP
MLDIGTKAPGFSLKDETGIVRTLEEYIGKKVLLYFYPKDDTPGCTKEACMIADVYADFERKGIAVLGVSKDSPRSHTKFKEKYKLPFTLLSDEKGDCIEAYGAWQNKSMFGRSFMGTARVSYVIDETGVVEKVYKEVDPATHALQILREVE